MVELRNVNFPFGKATEVTFEIAHNSGYIANLIRRLCYSISCTAPDTVNFFKNETCLLSEEMALRIALLPFPYYPDPENLIGRLEIKDNLKLGERSSINNHEIQLFYEEELVENWKENVPIVDICETIHNAAAVNLKITFKNGNKDDHSKFHCFTQLTYEIDNNSRTTKFKIEFDYYDIDNMKRFIEELKKLASEIEI